MKKYQYTINGKTYQVTVNKVEDTIAEVEVNGTPYQVYMDSATKQPVSVKRPVQQQMSATNVTPVVRTAKTISRSAIQSPLPGIILHIDCKVGDVIKKGQQLLVLEAMKMENSIPADRDGVVTEIKVNAGDSVAEGADLVFIK